MFIENVGQFDDGARFQIRGGGGGGLWLSDNALWLTLVEREQTSPHPSPQAGRESAGRHRYPPPAPVQAQQEWPDGPDALDLPLVDEAAASGCCLDLPPASGGTEGGLPLRGVNLRLSFVDANPHPRIEPFNRLETVVSYFIGNDPDQWRPAVPVWGGVRYVDLYPGIDLVVQGEQGRWSWQLVVRDDPAPLPAQPAAEAVTTRATRLASVRLQIDGAGAVTSGDTVPAGLLRLQTAIGDYALPLLPVVDHTGAPVAGLEPTAFASVSPLPSVGEPALSAERVEVPKEGPGVRGVSFHITAPFAPAITAVDEPAPVQALTTGGLGYSTLLGGLSGDAGKGIAVDSAGNAYVTGHTSSNDFPTTAGAFDRTLNGPWDAFVTKLNASGSALGYSTYLGGSDTEFGYAIAVDGAGNAYVMGRTWSANFPTTPSAFQRMFGGASDTFVVKLHASGSTLLYSTFLGDSGDDWAGGIAVDGAGNANVIGRTESADFPTTPGAVQSTYGGGTADVFIAKLNASGNALLFSSFLGGADRDDGTGIAVDSAGNAYVTGETRSADFPTTPDAFQRSYDGFAAVFIAKLSAVGGTLLYSTFLAGSGWDSGKAIAIDSIGNAYVTGYTLSTIFPTTPDAFQRTLAGGDSFVAKFDAAGRVLLFSTLLGGTSGDYGYGIALDGLGNTYVTGWTYSPDFPTTPGAFQRAFGGFPRDSFVAKLNATGSAVLYSTFLGGAGDDWGNAIAVDSAGNVYVTGDTDSSDFPTTAGAFGRTHNGSRDAFVTKLALATIVADFRAEPREGTAPLTVEFTDTSSGEITNWLWEFGDGGTSQQQHPVHTYVLPGIYTVTLTVTGPLGTDQVMAPEFVRVWPPREALTERVYLASVRRTAIETGW